MKGNKVKKICIGIVAAVLAILLAAVGAVYFNDGHIEFGTEDNRTETVQYGEAYSLPEVTAVYKGRLWNRSGIALAVTEEGKPDFNKLGSYTVCYTAVYGKQEKSISLTVNVVDTLPPEITLTSDPDSFTSPVAEYVEEGYMAVDNYDGDITDRVERTESDGIVTYSVTDSNGNRAEVTRTIVYRDAVAPVITLSGETDLSISLGESFEEPGYTAEDDCDGDLTESVLVSGTVDINTVGDYKLVYSVKDSSGNEGSAVRHILVKDSEPPVITLSGGTVFLSVGGEYEEPGFSAEDASDGDVTENVTVSGTVDSSSCGVYTLKYSVTDRSGNTGYATRTVYVYDKQAENATVDPGDKIVYLTFDDGPGAYTEKLLDILDKYNVKVTFFVTNQFPAYQNMIAEEAKRGHTVAIHTYSHDYATIYSSEEGYYADMMKMSDIIEKQTGIRPMLFRFPGGSSNTVSRKYQVGIMSALTKNLTAMGYRYFDWNVSSGDAGETTDKDVVVANVIAGISKHNISVVLQHDIKKYSVEAVEEIIVWGLANGYTFLPMDSTTPEVHHGVNN